MTEWEIITETGPGLISKVVEEWIKKRYDASFSIRNDFPDLMVPTLYGDILILPQLAVSGHDNDLDNPKTYAGHKVQSSWRFENKNTGGN